MRQICLVFRLCRGGTDVRPGPPGESSPARTPGDRGCPGSRKKLDPGTAPTPTFSARTSQNRRSLS